MSNKVINMFGNTVVPNTGVKYSELLEQFMTPFASEFVDIEYIEDIFELAISAWNFGNIKILMPQKPYEQVINSVQQEGEDIALLKKMICHKEEKYKKFTNFIIDFELKETKAGEDPILSVVTQEEEAYMSNMMSTLDNESSQYDFEENYINRSAIILKPQQPFIDWFFNLNPEDELDLEEDIKKTNIYLVDDGIDDVEKWLKKKFDTFFKMELNDWYDNKKEWPQKRNYKMFKLWFQVEISEMIYDLEKRPVLKSE